MEPVPAAVFRFEEGGCFRETADGDRQSYSLAQADLESALSLLKKLNLLRTKDGRRLSSLIQVDGFEPWWFVQDYLFSRLCLPYTRYRPLIEEALKGTPVVNPPPDLDRLLQALKALPETNTLRLEGRWRQRRTRRLGAALTQLLLAIGSIKAIYWFRLRRRSVLLYAIDVVTPGLGHDFRLDPIYRELARRKLSFGECFHSLGDARALLNAVRRLRLSIDIASLSAWWRGWTRDQENRPPLESSDPAAQAIAQLAWDAALDARSKYRCLRWVVRRCRPRLAVVLDDSRHAHELIAACRAEDVYVLSYQHGLAFNRYFVGLMCYGFDSARRHRANAYGLWS